MILFGLKMLSLQNYKLVVFYSSDFDLLWSICCGSSAKSANGEVRVVRVQVMAYTHYYVGDYEDVTEAFCLVDEHNTGRTPFDDAWYAYDDQGHCLRGRGNLRENKLTH